MAEWKAGIKLLLATYNGPSVTLTSKRNSFSDLIKETKGDEVFAFLFEREDFFDKEAFNDPVEGSTKGTQIHHHFNNFALSPSRATDELAKELAEITSDSGLVLPIQNEYIRTKWFVEAYNEVFKKLKQKEYEKYRKNFEKSPSCYLNIFSIHSSKLEKKTIKLESKDQSVFPVSVILVGPPGTGKTRASAIIAADIFEGKNPRLEPGALNSLSADFRLDPFMDDFYSIQFHPSFTYEDFFEGLRPVQVKSGAKTDVTYVVVPGVFKVICQLARAYWEEGKYGIELKAQFQSPSDSEVKDGTWQLRHSSLAGLYKLHERDGYLAYNGKTVLITGNPTDRAMVVPEGAEPNSSGLYDVTWFPMTGATKKPFVLFIDELNRGNPAKIFGEALSLIEETKRIGKPEHAEIVLPYSHEAFSVPPNLHIICAMNSSDKSLMSLDQAFRRRFRFVYLPPHFDVFLSQAFAEKTKIFSLDILKGLCSHFTTINHALKLTDISAENFIGHSYLFKILRETFEERSKDQKTNVAVLLRRRLKSTWDTDLHPQIREIVGEHRLVDFARNFKELVAKTPKEEGLFLHCKTDLAQILEKYLDEIQPKSEFYPWDEAA